MIYGILVGVGIHHRWAEDVFVSLVSLRLCIGVAVVTSIQVPLVHTRYFVWPGMT